MNPAEVLRARAEHMRDGAARARHQAELLERAADECEGEAKRMEEAAASRQRW